MGLFDAIGGAVVAKQTARGGKKVAKSIFNGVSGGKKKRGKRKRKKRSRKKRGW